MLKVHLSDGRTLRFDLEDAEQAAAWLHHAADPHFQAAITGLTVSHGGVSYSLPRPRDLRDEELFMFADRVPENGRTKGGERLSCHAGELRISMLIHARERAARVDVVRDGRLRYTPINAGTVHRS